MCICYTEMRILFINPRVFALKLSSDHPLGLCVRCFKIADVVVKYSQYRLSSYLRETTKNNSDILLYRKPRDSRRDNRTSVPFVLSPLLSGRNHEPTNKPTKKRDTDGMQNKGRNDVSAFPCLLATENGIGSSLTTKTSRKHRGDVFSKGNLHKQ